MEIVIKEFLEEINYIENSSIFLEDKENEPKTEWIEEIDSRTNFPFYWNSNTKESVWDVPKEYNEYLIKYETYLKDLMVNCEEMKRSELENDNTKNLNHMRGLIEYSDSEDELVETISNDINNEKTDENMLVELSPKQEETEEDLLLKKENWMTEQADDIELYLKKILKTMSETLISKVNCLKNENLASDSIRDSSIRVLTRLQDWSEGHLSLERKVETLRDALIEFASFEASLEADKWKLNWNSEKCDYFCTNIDTGEAVSHHPETKYACEEGEIIEDEDDLALDLEEYVSTALHRSFLDDSKSLEPLDDVRYSSENQAISEKKHETCLLETMSTSPVLEAEEVTDSDKLPDNSYCLEENLVDYDIEAENDGNDNEDQTKEKLADNT